MSPAFFWVRLQLGCRVRWALGRLRLAPQGHTILSLRGFNCCHLALIRAARSGSGAGCSLGLRARTWWSSELVGTPAGMRGSAVRAIALAGFACWAAGAVSLADAAAQGAVITTDCDGAADTGCGGHHKGARHTLREKMHAKCTQNDAGIPIVDMSAPSCGKVAAAPRQPAGGRLTAGHPQQHKPLFPLDGNDAAVLVITVATLLLAAGGGVGGGAIFVPLFSAVGGEHARCRLAFDEVDDDVPVGGGGAFGTDRPLAACCHRLRARTDAGDARAPRRARHARRLHPVVAAGGPPPALPPPQASPPPRPWLSATLRSWAAPLPTSASTFSASTPGWP